MEFVSAIDSIVRRQTTDPNAGTISGSGSGSDSNQLLDLVSNPFQSSFQANAFWASFGTSIGFTILLALLFSLVRPRHRLVYAPKTKHADDKHAPPPMGNGIFAWVTPVLRTKEDFLAERIGLDATIFLRFTAMLRNIFLILSLVGCLIMIPVNIASGDKNISRGQSAFRLLTPLYVFGNAFWSHVVCVWAFDAIVAYFLWHNYRCVRKLRRDYFQGSEYQACLHARTVMITDVPENMRTDEGLVRVTDEVNPTGTLPRATIGRNVKILPNLIEEHKQAVMKLESVLAKFLKNPDNLPSRRPMIRPPRKYRRGKTNAKVDAIDFLTSRIQELEQEIRDVRDRIDKRDAMPFGFASWERIEQAHAVAYSARKKHPQGTTIRLAPRPNDLIWENLAIGKAGRRAKRLINMAWVAILTLLWTPINGAIAIFLSNLSNLGSVWPGFQRQLNGHTQAWAVVQGIASPAITSLFYLVLPIIFRRLSIRAGDTTKSARERHVTHNLYAFFVFNNLLVFSLFSAIWAFVAAVIQAKESNSNVWDAIKKGEFYVKVMISLCQVSPFWVTWLLQRNLGAAIDLAQLVNLTWVWFARTFMAPTPRQNIEWTAPPPFDYASYYNYFLFYATVALCFSTLQPLVLPVTALYFSLDAFLKKYLLMYVFITKTESAGQHWKMLYNRMISAAILSNIIIAMIVLARGRWVMIGVIGPAPLLLLGFKWYCVRTFDDDIQYFVRSGMQDQENLAADSKSKRVDRVTSKFGHPALCRPLMTPMVHAKAQAALSHVYRGRLNSDSGRSMAFSDIAMEPMANNGKRKESAAPFEIVSEAKQDFAYYKNRADFRAEGGDIYGRPEDLISERSHTPMSFMGPYGIWSPSSSRDSSPAGSERGGIPRKELDESHVHPAFRSGNTTRSSSGNREAAAADLGMREGLYTDPYADESQTNLLRHAQTLDGHDMTATTPGEQLGMDRWRTGGSGYGPFGQEDEPGSYDFFKERR